MDQSSLNVQLLQAAAVGDLDLVQQLCDSGANVLCADSEGISSLMKAAENGHAQMVEALLELGAPWNQLDNDNYCAGEYASKHKDIAELLLHWGVQAELMLADEARDEASKGGPSTSHANTSYLEQKLHYSESGDTLLDADGEGVMMGWEKPLMLRHAELICRSTCSGGDILNIGFGLGIIDEAIQSHNPTTHTIVEAHPDVYAHMLQKGWGQRPGVRILFGRWQDVLPSLGTYSGIFFDTYGEYYEELRTFQNQLPALLQPGGCYSFFNGLAPDNIFFHSVYCRLVQLELESVGLSTHYTPMNIKALGADVWEDINPYWKFETYFLPECRFIKPSSEAMAAVCQEET